MWYVCMLHLLDGCASLCVCVTYSFVLYVVCALIGVCAICDVCVLYVKYVLHVCMYACVLDG